MMSVAEAFEVLENKKNYSIGKVMQASAVLSQAKGKQIQKAVKQLIKNLEEGQSNVALISVISLGEIGDASAVEPLNKLLEKTTDDDPLLRNAISETKIKIFYKTP